MLQKVENFSVVIGENKKKPYDSYAQLKTDVGTFYEYLEKQYPGYKLTELANIISDIRGDKYSAKAETYPSITKEVSMFAAYARKYSDADVRLHYEPSKNGASSRWEAYVYFGGTHNVGLTHLIDDKKFRAWVGSGDRVIDEEEFDENWAEKMRVEVDRAYAQRARRAVGAEARMSGTFQARITVMVAKWKGAKAEDILSRPFSKASDRDEFIKMASERRAGKDHLAKVLAECITDYTECHIDDIIEVKAEPFVMD